MSIADFLKKGNVLKSYLEHKDLFITLLIILIGFAGFGLGRLSIAQKAKPPVTIQNVFKEASFAAVGPSEDLLDNRGGGTDDAQTGFLVASKNGSKYHFPWCSGAQRMKEANKIWFRSYKEAQQAGYTPAKNCRGLE